MIGKCMTMCPLEEIRMREREKLLHRLEMDAPHSRRANAKKCVKEYRRPTVGKQDIDPNEVRPPAVLLETTFYLIDKVATERCEWADIYDFVFDRLRSVRQDLVMQDVNDINAVGILERAVRFHIYSDYRLCMAHMAVFDQKINDQHAQECLKRLINLYNTIGSDAWTNRIEMESVYLLFNLGDLHAIRHYYTLPDHLRHSEEIQLAYRMSCACLNNNWRKVFRNMAVLKSPIYLCALHRHFPLMQRNALHIMNIAYSSKNAKFPLEKLKQLIALNTDTEAQSLCKQFSVEVDGTFAHFQRASFNADEKVKRNPCDFINSVLKQQTIPQILHGNKDTNSDLCEQLSHLCRT